MKSSVKNALGRFVSIVVNLCSALYRDLIGIYYVLTVENKIKRITKKQEVLADLFEKLVRTQPNKPCIIFQDQTWTFQDVDQYSNQIANIFLHEFNLRKGDCVALLLENKPEYVATWIGLSKIGVISALINTNLKSKPLLHSLTLAQPKAIIYDARLAANIKTVRQDLDLSVTKLIVDDYDHSSTEPLPEGTMNLQELLMRAPTGPVLPSLVEKCTPNDPIMYVYTSGTTGMPKPAVIKQSRYCAGGILFYSLANLNANDIVYVTLPIYHANGAIIGVGNAIVSGATVVLRGKFSASSFWRDCIDYKCTAFIYVGEICRFLVNQPPGELDRKHMIRKAIGNGLRENVWHEFYQRFGVDCIEFYAASEGNCTIVNLTSKIGACGFVPLINKLVKVLSVYIIKIDDEMRPIRDKHGFCIECKSGEKGLLIGLIGTSAKTAYNGYANNKQASNGKIIEDVFKKGQRAFNSGDVMICDAYGYLYFCDRLGDTFRWRGENVATVEVENCISGHLNSAEVNVYGVEVPGQEGRAGMAALMRQDVDVDALAGHLKANLPSYAKPLFLRLSKEFDYTGSFKAIKKRLVDENYDITRVTDKMFYFDSSQQRFLELTKQVYANIQSGQVRF